MKKPWYKRRRNWAVVIVLLLIYFCLIPSPLRVSPETTGITGPLTPEGKVDYFGAFESSYLDRLNPPEENGLRQIIAACGPWVLEQSALARDVPWEEMQTNEHGKNWFENRWKPLCEHLQIDPYVKPRFFDSGGVGFELHMRKHLKPLEGEEDRAKNERISALYDKLIKDLWKAEDHPEVADWLQAQQPLLELFGNAVRKPNYVSWRQPSVGGMFCILLPDVQAQRDFVRRLSVRINERIPRGDLEGAWYDLMSMMHLGFHFKQEPILVTNLVGIAAEGIAYDSMQRLIQSGNPSKEQLERFAREWNALSRKTAFEKSLRFDRFGAYEFFQMSRLRKKVFWEMLYESGTFSGRKMNTSIAMKLVRMLPIDPNIAGARYSELCETNRLSDARRREIAANAALGREYVNKGNERIEQVEPRLDGVGFWLRVPLIRTRSQWVAETLFVSTAPAYHEAAVNAFSRTEAMYRICRIAIALERYKTEHGDYPEKLDSLLDAYLDEIPLDPFTSRLTIQYQLRPEKGCVYRLYSYGPNAKDDNGIGDFSGKNANDDVVFSKQEPASKN